MGVSRGRAEGGGEVDLGILDEPPESLELAFRELAVQALDIAVQKCWNGEQIENKRKDVGVEKMRDVGEMKKQIERFVERQGREQVSLLDARLMLDLLVVHLARGIRKAQDDGAEAGGGALGERELVVMAAGPSFWQSKRGRRPFLNRK